jgi:hypothetical protein
MDDIRVPVSDLPPIEYIQNKEQEGIEEGWLFYDLDAPRIHYIPFFKNEPAHYIHSRCWCDPANGRAYVWYHTRTN